MRRVVAGFVVLLVATGCQRTFATPPDTSVSGVLVRSTSTRFTEVTAGPVRALIPDEWDAVAAGGVGAVETGLFASPEPEAFARGDGSVAGLSATWVDTTLVGVPSDYYYAAARPVVAGLTSSRTCIEDYHRVIVNNRPTWMAGPESSPGDFLARGMGSCEVRGIPTRWAYFVAAPGFGAERTIGIRTSGLYVVVAVLPATPEAPRLLRTLLAQTSFGGAGIRDFVNAARGFPEPVAIP
ncbi:MAG TPA: hypothetical protein VGR41_00535 [Actinomycetota bacterium]|nr:hypothetical protein [Actinomycetota bacterium]